MRWCLRWSGKTRRVFSRLPHWIRDLYGFVSHANFIELIPTLAAIGLAPRHFFRRLPLTLSGVRRHYQTPVKFFFNFAALFLAVFYMRHGDMAELAERADALWYLPAIIPLTPPLMILLGTVTWILYQIPRIAPNGDAFPPPNSAPFQLLLDPRTYFKLDYGRFLWGLFYISIYLLAAWQIVQVAIALNFLGVVQLTAAMGDGHVVPKAILALLGIALTALCIHGMILHPYIEMLRASLRLPTRAVFASDVNEIRQAISEFLAIQISDPALSFHAKNLLTTIRGEAKRLQNVIAQQNLEYDLPRSLVDERVRVHREAFQIDRLRGQLASVDPSVAASFEKVLARFDGISEYSFRRAS